MKTFYELGYMDIDEARQIAGEMNMHHFHYYASGMVTYKKEYIHLYKRELEAEQPEKMTKLTEGKSFQRMLTEWYEEINSV